MRTPARMESIGKRLAELDSAPSRTRTVDSGSESGMTLRGPCQRAASPEILFRAALRRAARSCGLMLLRTYASRY